MRFAVLVVFFIVATAVCYCQSVTVEELIKTANYAGAPFTQIALARMHNSELWGAKRANSSVDVVIINASALRYKLRVVKCYCGTLSPGLWPQPRVYSHTSTVFGLQSSEGKQDFECILGYRDMNLRSFFGIVLRKTLNDIDDIVEYDSSGDLKINTVGGEGNDSQLTIIVSDNISGPVDMRSEQSATWVPHSKPKGSRNKFVMASKSGSSVRTI